MIRDYDKILDALFNDVNVERRELSTRHELNTEKKTNATKDIPKVDNRRIVPTPKRIICDNPATIIYWDDGTKTVVKCDAGEKEYDENGNFIGYKREPDVYTVEGGVSAAYIKKIFGSRCEFKRMLEMAEIKKVKTPKNKTGSPINTDNCPTYEYGEQLHFDFGDDNNIESGVSK